MFLIFAKNSGNIILVEDLDIDENCMQMKTNNIYKKSCVDVKSF